MVERPWDVRSRARLVRPTRAVRRGIGVVLALALMSTGCSESNPVEGNARDAAVVEQVIRSIVAGEELDPDKVPVVFVVGAESDIPIEVQAAVAAGMLDEVDVRFADSRAEAIDDGLEVLPVRDGGLLVVVGPVPAEGRRIDVLAERYRDATDSNSLVVSLQWREPEWSVTSTSVLPPVIE